MGVWGTVYGCMGYSVWVYRVQCIGVWGTVHRCMGCSA